MKKHISLCVTPFLLLLFTLALLGGCVAKKPVDTTAGQLPEATEQTAGAVDDESKAVTPLPEDVEALAQAGNEPLTPEEQRALDSQVDVRFELDSRDTKEVRQYFEYFTHHKRGRKNFEAWLKRSEHYLPYVRKVFAERGLPHELVYLPFVESGYNPKIRSRAGACGMWQFMPFTGRKYGLKVGWWVDERNDPYKATEAAADYLTKLHEEFDDWYLALAAYNAGEGRVAKAIRKTGCDDFFELSKKRQKRWRRGRRLYYLPRETRYYVPKLMAVIKIVQNLEELGFEKPNWDGSAEVATVTVPPRTHLKAMAKDVGMTWEEFRNYNPAFVEPGSHPKESCTVYLPVDKAEPATAWLTSDNYKEFKSYYTFYKVRRGDSWYRISRRHGVPIAVLKKYNNRRSNLLRPGQSIKVPGRGETRLTAQQIKKQRRNRSANAKKVRQLAQSRSNYKVQSGDSLWTVAKHYGTTVATLAKANGISSKSRLRVGQSLYIPDSSPVKARQNTAQAMHAKSSIANHTHTASGPYKVRSGDSLWSIATDHGMSVATLAKANGLSSKSRLRVGQTLTIPGQSTAQNSAPATTQTYRVRKGDTLYSIARKFGVSTDSILTWNEMNSSRIYPGDAIKVKQ